MPAKPLGRAAAPAASVPTRLPRMTASSPRKRTMPVTALPLTTLSCTTTPSAFVKFTPLAVESLIVLPRTTAPAAGSTAPTPPPLPTMTFPSPADGPPTTRLAPARAATPLAVLPSVLPVRLRPIHEPRSARPASASAKTPLVQLVMLRPVIATPVWPGPACRPVPTDGSLQCSSTSGTSPVRVPVTVVPVDSMGSCAGPIVIVPLPVASKTMSSGPPACASVIACRSEPAPPSAVVVTWIVAAEAPAGAIAAARSATRMDVRVMTRNATGPARAEDRGSSRVRPTRRAPAT